MVWSGYHHLKGTSDPKHPHLEGDHCCISLLYVFQTCMVVSKKIKIPESVAQLRFPWEEIFTKVLTHFA